MDQIRDKFSQVQVTINICKNLINLYIYITKQQNIFCSHIYPYLASALLSKPSFNIFLKF